jgi:hypothetical protein
MRQLRLDFDAVVASRRHRPLLVQRMRTLPQDEQRNQSTPTEASTPTGAFFFFFFLTPLKTNNKCTRFSHLPKKKKIYAGKGSVDCMGKAFPFLITSSRS